MKKFIIAGLCVAGVVTFLFCVSPFLKAQGSPDSVTVPGGSFGEVTFNHKLHAEIASCKDCHHLGEVTQKCNSCHTADASLNSKDAFHKNCMDCHKAKEQGPLGCMECHKKS